MKNFISIIIPTYNRSAFVVEAVQSALNQTYKNYEIIVIDDGSTDDTLERLAKYNDRIQLISQANKGVSAARNTGIKASRGDLIALLDSDDLWMKEKLSIQVDFMQRNVGINICQTDEIWLRNGVRVNPKNIHKKYSGFIFEKCIPLCIISPSAVIIRKKIFDKVGLFDESMPLCEDYDLWLRASLKHEVATLPEALIYKRGGHSDQLSKNRGQDVWRIYALQKILKSSLLNPKQETLVKKDILRRAKIVQEGAAKRNNQELALQMNALMLD